MSQTRLLALSGAIALAMTMPMLAHAKVDAAKAATLGTTLNPVGADKNKNADGSIPAWTGGRPQQGSLAGQYFTDAKLEGQKPLFTVTSANMAQYAAFLTAGHQEMLRKYPTFKMNVYPSERTVSYPAVIVETTKKNAETATLTGTDGMANASVGFPFPIPARAEEVIWNHKTRWRGNNARRYNNQAIVQADGSVAMSKLVEEVQFVYGNSGAVGKPMPSDLLYYLSEQLAPPKSAGQLILATELMNGGRDAYLYNPGLRRTRKAPGIAFDQPAEGTDNNQTVDQIDMFNGALSRYKWTLKGKKDMIIAYNSIKMASNKTKYAQILTKSHVNTDLARYEKHRVWIVDAQNSGTGLPAHIFGRRTFYLDEDSWTIAAVDCYDKQGKFFKFQESHLGFSPNIQATNSAIEAIYDLTSGRYFVTAMANEDKPNDFTVTFPAGYFTANAMAKKATR